MAHDYEALADAAERGELNSIAGTALRGRAAAAKGREMLMKATGITDLNELTRLGMGRPAEGTSSGVSPSVSARVPQVLKDRLHALAQREHRNEADILREALVVYLKNQEARPNKSKTVD